MHGRRAIEFRSMAVRADEARHDAAHAATNPQGVRTTVGEIKHIRTGSGYYDLVARWALSGLVPPMQNVRVERHRENLD